ncbi:hypothetical protein Tco_1272792 [Tanacetum coccineum]
MIDHYVALLSFRLCLGVTLIKNNLLQLNYVSDSAALYVDLGKKSGSARIKIVEETVVGARDGVVNYERGMIIVIVGGTVVIGAVEVSRIAITGTVKRGGA